MKRICERHGELSVDETSMLCGTGADVEVCSQCHRTVQYVSEPSDRVAVLMGLAAVAALALIGYVALKVILG